jgi:hypothetical protein
VDAAAADFVWSVVLLLFAVFVLVGSLLMPLRGRIITAPGLVPAFLGAILIFSSILLLVSAVKGKGVSHVKSWIVAKLKDVEFKRWLKITLITGVFIFSVGRIPFHIATFAYLVVMFSCLNVKTKSSRRYWRYWPIVLVAAVATVFLSVVIPRIFGMPLP